MDRDALTRQTDAPETRGLFRSRSDRMVGGVAGGLAAYFGIDVALVRLMAVVLGVTGPGVPIYIVMWIVIPEESAELGAATATPRAPTSDTTKRMFGFALVALGTWMLAERWIPWLDEIFWPSLLIALGAGLLIFGVKR
jgi:phage shock protein PspC (stress-responsive transcriptional regulator)